MQTIALNMKIIQNELKRAVEVKSLLAIRHNTKCNAMEWKENKRKFKQQKFSIICSFHRMLIRRKKCVFKYAWRDAKFRWLNGIFRGMRILFWKINSSH